MPSRRAASTKASKAAASVRASWTSSSRKDACGSGRRGDGGGRSKGVCGGDRGAFSIPMAESRARIESTATVDSRTISLVRNALLS